MTFLWPVALGLLAFAVPIVAFYLVKTRVPRKTVSTLLFWENIRPQLMQQPFWRKLRRWISLALQLLFLLLLVLALAQPQPSGKWLKPQRTVFVLDASASMRAKDVSPSRWDQALDLIRARINRMRHFDEAAIILGEDPPQILCGWTSNQRLLKAALAKISPSLRAEDQRSSVGLAASLALSRENANVAFVSDGVLPYPVERREKPPVMWEKVGGEAVNTGITLFSARRSAVSSGDYQISASVESNEKQPEAVQLEISQNGNLLDVQDIQLQPGKPWQKTWQNHGTEAARFHVRISGMKKDDLAEDNQAEVAIPELHKVSVLLVSEKNAFLEAALRSMNFVDWQAVRPSEVSGGKIDAADIVIYYHCVPAPDAHPRAVVLIDPPGSGFWGKAGEILPAPLVSDWQKDSIPLRYISLDQVRLNQATAFQPAPGAVVFAESFGQPLIFGDWEASPRWIALSFDLEQSDFVLRTAFPIFLGNLLQSLRTTGDVQSALLPGPVVTKMEVTFRDPSGEKSPQPALNATAWFASHPIWWWLLVLGALWQLIEWRLYSRRITE